MAQVRARLYWGQPPPRGVGIPAFQHHHDVMRAVTALAGPKSRWWSDIDSSSGVPQRGPLRVTSEAVIRESLRVAFGLRCTDRMLYHHIHTCFVLLEFSGKRRHFVKLGEINDLMWPFDLVMAS